MAVGVDLNIMEPPHICQDEDSLQVGGCRCVCVCVCVCVCGRIRSHRERERKQNNSPNMSWFETGFNPNFRPTKGLFQGLVRQCGSYGSDYDIYIFMKVSLSLSPDVIPCGGLGSKHQLN